MWHDNILSLILFLAAMFIAKKNIILAKDLQLEAFFALLKFSFDNYIIFSIINLLVILQGRTLKGV